MLIRLQHSEGRHKAVGAWAAGIPVGAAFRWPLDNNDGAGNIEDCSSLTHPIDAAYPSQEHSLWEPWIQSIPHGCGGVGGKTAANG
jgi:hypothetical protein